MLSTLFQTSDFWRVNSYSYPNYFSSDNKAQEAWQTFDSFFNHHGGRYSDLKAFWTSRQAPRKLDNHAVESWKANFEELGLLYVISRSDRVTVTPAGFQLRQAATDGDERKFAWIGTNLLLRFPLSGPPSPRRRPTSHADSDLLPYRFLLSAMRDLGDYFWFTELERILCRVFSTTEANPATEAVKQLRADPRHLREYPLIVPNKKGAFYNSLNQVANHAGQNHLTLTQDNDSEHYGPAESRRRHGINRSFLSLISIALGDDLTTGACRTSAKYVDRLPAAPRLGDEQTYFDYLGTEVGPLNEGGGSTPKSVTIAGDTVFILKEGEQFAQVAADGTTWTVEGRSEVLCTLARGHRIILSSNLAWTLLVVGKNLVAPDRVQLILRRARPITNAEPIQQVLDA